MAISTYTKVKKKWEEVPLIAKAGLIGVTGYVIWQLTKAGKKPDRLKVNLSNVSSLERADLEEIASELFSSMDGANLPAYGVTDRSIAWNELTQYMGKIDALRYIHNYWLSNVDESESIFNWINSQTVLPYSQEEGSKAEAILALQLAGAGKID